jgi:hypothetical protein
MSKIYDFKVLDMKKSMVGLSLCSMALFASMGSSIKVPTQEHLKYTFGNHKNHPVQKMEASQYYRSIAPMEAEDIRRHLSERGYSVRGIQLRDIASELVYQVYVKDGAAKRLRLYVDPSTGSVLKTETE